MTFCNTISDNWSDETRLQVSRANALSPDACLVLHAGSARRLSELEPPWAFFPLHPKSRDLNIKYGIGKSALKGGLAQGAIKGARG
ncbi:hypothetical protein OPQ81_007209 [Rhizoctonia solani]|nr:hypothetical protein OPQ81_007209 [Rhizoctonia solani]